MVAGDRLSQSRQLKSVAGTFATQPLNIKRGQSRVAGPGHINIVQRQMRSSTAQPTKCALRIVGYVLPSDVAAVDHETHGNAGEQGGQKRSVAGACQATVGRAVQEVHTIRANRTGCLLRTTPQADDPIRFSGAALADSRSTLILRCSVLLSPRHRHKLWGGERLCRSGRCACEERQQQDACGDAAAGVE